MAAFKADGAVELYYDNTKTFETASGGAGVVGNLFLSGEFNMTTGGNKNRFIDCSVDEGEALYIRSTNGGDANHEYMASFIRGGAVELYHNESKKFETTANGVKVNNRFEIRNGVIFDNTANGNNCGISFNGDGIRPTNGSGTETNNTYDLGHPSFRWRNVYTNDLCLSNEGGSNDVDGTWGSYTIQEGADDLFLINKRTGKKYKFNLTEVS